MGSGDSMINAYFLGAKKVVCFDINQLSEYIGWLKLRALQHLKYDEFIDFFGRGKNDAALSYSVYQQIRRYLPSSVRDFFDKTYAHFHFNGKSIRKSILIRQRSLSPFLVNAYLKNERTFSKAKNCLRGKKISFVNVGLGKLLKTPQLRNKKFDLINLSNIPNFVTQNDLEHGGKDPTMKFYDTILLPLSKLLNKEGSIMYYGYADRDYPNPIIQEKPPATRKNQVNRMKKRLDFQFHFFKVNGVNFNGQLHSKNEVFVFRKYL